MALQRIKSYIAQCGRVWNILKKPTKKEFRSISKISAIGILAIGLMGFLISIIISVFK